MSFLWRREDGSYWLQIQSHWWRDYRNPDPESIWKYCHGAFGFHCWKKYLWIGAARSSMSDNIESLIFLVYICFLSCMSEITFLHMKVTLIFKSYQFRVLGSCLSVQGKRISCFMEHASIRSDQQSFSSHPIPCFIKHASIRSDQQSFSSHPRFHLAS